jgi:hypothetical protein
MKSVKYIGLDVHQATISIAVLDANGKLAMQSVIATQASTILVPRPVTLVRCLHSQVWFGHPSKTRDRLQNLGSSHQRQ